LETPLKKQRAMKEPVKTDDKTLLNPEKEEAVNTNEADDINQFIRKTQLQNQILKKITESLKQPAEKEMKSLKSKS
jgi:hypothetical protein